MKRQAVVVAVADSAQTRVFEAQAPAEALRELEALHNGEARKHEGDLVADTAGRMNRRPFEAGHSAFGGGSMKRHRAEDFAGRSCRHIEQAVRRSGARRLYLVADPETLGLLRQRMDESVRKCVAGEVAKSLANEEIGRIRQALPARL